jgi:hypothetical protein
VLCCAVLCCAVLCCAVLCCAALCCAVLCHSLVRPQDLKFVGMMQYDGDLLLPANYLVPPPEIHKTSGEYLVHNGISTFACSETQKFGHVTFFWNGNRSGYFDSKLETYLEVGLGLQLLLACMCAHSNAACTSCSCALEPCLTCICLFEPCLQSCAMLPRATLGCAVLIPPRSPVTRCPSTSCQT